MNEEMEYKPVGNYLFFAWMVVLYIFAAYWALQFNISG